MSLKKNRLGTEIVPLLEGFQALLCRHLHCATASTDQHLTVKKTPSFKAQEQYVKQGFLFTDLPLNLVYA